MKDKYTVVPSARPLTILPRKITKTKPVVKGQILRLPPKKYEIVFYRLGRPARIEAMKVAGARNTWELVGYDEEGRTIARMTVDEWWLFNKRPPIHVLPPLPA